MANHPQMNTSGSTEWETPPEFMALMRHRYGEFTLDPAASVHNHQCDRFFTEWDDGLNQRWRSKNVWLNPPYGRGIVGPWVEKAWEEVRLGHAKQVVVLLPNRSDQWWWHDFVMFASEVAFVKGRIHFVGGSAGATFPSVVMVFKADDFNQTRPEYVSIGRRIDE